MEGEGNKELKKMNEERKVQKERWKKRGRRKVEDGEGRWLKKGRRRKQGSQGRKE